MTKHLRSTPPTLHAIPALPSERRQWRRAGRSAALLILATGAAAGLLACGGDDDDPGVTATGTPTTTASTSATTATSTGTASATATPTQAGELKLIPGTPAELGAPAVPAGTTPSEPSGLGVAAAAAQYDTFGTDAELGEFPRTITHAMGSTTIETKPIRIVVLDSGELDTAVTLGVKPVGALDYDPATLPQYLQDGLTEAETVGVLAEPNLEAIAALKPDLILSSKIRHEKIYDQLAAIAPTVFGVSTGVVWKQNFSLYAQAMGLESEASEVVLAYEERVRELNQKLPTPRPTVSVVRVLANNIRYYQMANYSGTLLTDLGFPRPEPQNVDSFALLNQSLETVGQFAGGDLIVVAPAAGPDDAYVKEMLASPLWQSLNAVKSGDVLLVEDDVWMAGIGYQAADVIMNQIAAQFGVE